MLTRSLLDKHYLMMLRKVLQMDQAQESLLIMEKYFYVVLDV